MDTSPTRSPSPVLSSPPADRHAIVPLSVPRTCVSTIPARFDLAYAWDYATERTDLRNLYEKSKDSMWNARTDIPWDTNVDPEGPNAPDEMIPIFGTHLWDKLDKKTELPKLRRLNISYLLSNFLHGEQGALLATAQIACSVPSTDAKFYAATQVMDEARHVEAYDRYLREKIEYTFLISPYLRTLLDQILMDSRWDVKYLGMQILVEGLALAAFGTLSQSSQEPLIRDIIHRIMQDEARHVAFGVLSLKGVYEQMSPAEYAEREDFIIEGSRLMHDRFLLQEVWAEMGMPVQECVEIVRHSPIMAVFRKLLFSKIVPNVKRLGLLGPRVRRGFEELGVIEFEHWDASA